MEITRRTLLRQFAAGAALSALPSIGLSAAEKSASWIRLSRNENAYGPSPLAIDALARAGAGALHRFPDAAEDALRSAIAAHHRVSPKQVVLGSGSTAVMRM